LARLGKAGGRHRLSHRRTREGVKWLMHRSDDEAHEPGDRFFSFRFEVLHILLPFAPSYFTTEAKASLAL
jgi:hypothetical protein